MVPFLRKQVPIRLALLALVGLGFCVALLASASPELHHHLHHEADHDEHECLVTTLMSGGVDSAPAVLFVVQAPVVTPALLIASEGIASHSFFLECSVFEHGPPILS